MHLSSFGYFLPVLKVGFLGLISYAQADSKVWLRDTNFNNTNNWFPRRLPTEADLAVFPFYLNVEIMLSSMVSICEMVLPYQGEILLPKDGFLQVNNLHCDSRVNFVRNRIEIWENPLNWWSEKKNKATPHAYQIPCQYDDVIFAPSSTFAVRLPPVPTAVRSFIINYQYLDSQELQSFLVDSEIGRKQFFRDEEDPIPTVSGAACTNPSGCSRGTERLLQLSCDTFSSRLCAAPRCLDPIKPAGHCCYICGVVLEFKYDSKKFKISELRLMLDSYVNLVQNQQGVHLVHHVGKTDSGTIQIVLMEKDGYEGSVITVANQLKVNILSDEELGLTLHKLLLPGQPYDPTEVFFVFKIFFAIILLLIVGILCVIMYRSNLNFHQMFSSSTLSNFVRFENQSGEVELRYEAQPKLRKSFHNPLFQSTSEDTEVIMSEENEEEIPSTSYGNLTQEISVPESKHHVDNVEMDEMPAPKLDDRLLHDVDLN